MQKILTLIGNIGSGKSTLLPLLAKELKLKQVDADTLFQSTDPFAAEYLRDMSRWAFTNELWLTYERVKILKAVGSSNLLVDSGLMMSWVYTHAHFFVGRLAQAEWQLYQDLFNDWSGQLDATQAVVYIKYPVEILLQRIKERGRGYELEWYTPEYLSELEASLDALAGQLQDKGVPVLILENLGDVRRDAAVVEEVALKVVELTSA